MARATFPQMVAEIQRMPGLSSIPVGEIGDALQKATKDLGNQPWPWNYAESNVLVPAAYSTGTVNVTDGQAVVNLVGGSWAPYVGQQGWRIIFGDSNLDYIVQVFTAPGILVLAQVVNLGASIVNGSYRIYKDTYFYPSDYIIGSDVALLQPVIRTRIPKIPRYKFEMVMNSGIRSMASDNQMIYCDQGQGRDINGVPYYQFRLGPPPISTAELRLCYHSMAADINPLLTTIQAAIPDGYDEIIELQAASRLYDFHKQPGMSEGVKAIALGKIKLLKRQVASQTIDDVPDALYEIPDSSISQWGMMIGRMS